MSIPAWILPAQGCLSFQFPPARDQELLGKQQELVSAARHPSLAPFPVSLQLGTGVQGCTNTPKCGGMVSGDLVTLGYCSQSTRIPRDCHVLVPTYQDPQPEEDPAGHREGRVAVLRQCQDDPEANVDNSIEDVDGLGKDEEEESLSRYCETHPTPIPHHSAGKDLSQHPLQPARDNIQQDNPCGSPIPAGPLEGHVSPPTPWDEPSGSLVFAMRSWQGPGSLRPAGPPGDPWPGSPP